MTMGWIRLPSVLGAQKRKPEQGAAAFWLCAHACRLHLRTPRAILIPRQKEVRWTSAR